MFSCRCVSLAVVSGTGTVPDTLVQVVGCLTLCLNFLHGIKMKIIEKDIWPNTEGKRRVETQNK